MTLFHFGNCLALGCGPFFILYKSSGLSEYSSFWKCVKAGAAYFITQLCKMLILATFFPTTEVPEDKIDVLGEFMKSTVDIGDLLGFHIIMTKIPGRGELKVLVAGLGWSSAEFLTTKLIPLWVGARGIEFDWKYIQFSLDANISLVQCLAVGTLVWLWSRTDLQKAYTPFVFLLLVLCCYRPFIIELVCFLFGITSWSLLGFKAIYSGVIGSLALQIYLGLVKTIKTY